MKWYIGQPCSVFGCTGKISAPKLGLCRRHYVKKRAHGSVFGGRQTIDGEPIRFLQSLLNKDIDSCIIWPFARATNGYAQIHIKKVKQGAHRVICEMMNGAPEELTLDAAHSCGNGQLGCVNPKHLQWKTRSENHKDKMQHGTALVGSKNHSSKLKESDIENIVQMKANGLTMAKIARNFGVTNSCIENIFKGKSWKWKTGL